MKRPLYALLVAWLCTALPWRAHASGDCNGNGVVTIAELIVAVRISLGDLPVSDCASIDTNGDGRVRVTEIIAAIRGFGPAPTAAPTPTATPAPSASAAPSSTPAADDQAPPTEADALATWLAEGRYLAWAAESAPHPGAGPHFGVVRTFVNDALFDSLTAAQAQHPPGAAAVKELYGRSGDTVLGWAVMTKLQADSAAGQGWYWYEAFGTFASGGVGLSICTGCHADGRDFVRIPFPLQ